MSNADEFAGFRAVVTGGSSGIGRRTAEELMVRGAVVAVLDLQPDDAPPDAMGVACNVAHDESVIAAVATAAEYLGGIDGVVNNAGIGAQGTVEAGTLDDWRKVLDVNVLGTVRVTRAALPHLRRSQNPAVVNTCSIAATAGLPGRALYSASKGAVEAMTRAMAADHVREGIRFNCVNPGTVDTPWVRRLLEAATDPDAEAEQLRQRQPTGRLVTDAEVAGAICYLLNPGSSATTGTSLAVDGGMSGLRIPPRRGGMRAPRPFGRAGLKVAPLSFGAAAIGNLFTAVDDAAATEAVRTAADAGIDYYDTAPHYGLGLSERRLGAALEDRTDVVISTKVGRLLQPATEHRGDGDAEGFAVAADVERVWDFSRDGVLRSIESSLERLGRDRIDVVYVHDPDEHFAEAMDGAFPALDELRRQGVIASYGAGMNQSAMLTRFVRETDLDAVLIAGRYTVLDRSAADDLLPACLERDVSVAAGGVFNSGITATADPRPGATYDYAPVTLRVLDRARRLAAVCREHGTTLPHAAVHFPLRHPAVRTVLLGMRSADEVRADLDLLAAPPPDALWSDLEAAL